MTFLVWVSSSISVSFGRRLQKRPAVCQVVPASHLGHHHLCILHIYQDTSHISSLYKYGILAANVKAARDLNDLTKEPRVSC